MPAAHRGGEGLGECSMLLLTLLRPRPERQSASGFRAQAAIGAAQREAGAAREARADVAWREADVARRETAVARAQAAADEARVPLRHFSATPPDWLFTLIISNTNIWCSLAMSVGKRLSPASYRKRCVLRSFEGR